MIVQRAHEQIKLEQIHSSRLQQDLGQKQTGFGAFRSKRFIFGSKAAHGSTYGPGKDNIALL